MRTGVPSNIGMVLVRVVGPHLGQLRGVADDRRKVAVLPLDIDAVEAVGEEPDRVLDRVADPDVGERVTVGTGIGPERVDE